MASWPRSLRARSPKPPRPNTVNGKNHFCILLLPLYRHLRETKVARKITAHGISSYLLRCCFKHLLTPNCTKNGALRKQDSICDPPHQAPPGHLARFPNFNVIIADKELRRALIGAADHRQQSRYLPP